MAVILVNFYSQSWSDQDWLRDSLWGGGKRMHEAIWKASNELKTNWLDLCYEALGLTYDGSVQIELSTINDFFMFDALNYLDEIAGEDEGEKPSDKILKFCPKED